MKDNAIMKEKRVVIYNSPVMPNLIYNIVANAPDEALRHGAAQLGT